MALVEEHAHGNAYFADFETFKHESEEEILRYLLSQLTLEQSARDGIGAVAASIVARARANKQDRGTLDTFLQEFGLSNQEGIALMCLAEALLRVPDAETADRLIAEKIKSGNWQSHSGKSDSLLVNASTWGLMLTGRVIELAPQIHRNTSDYMRSLVSKSGEPVIRAAMMQAMRIMGEQFVLGRTIASAMKRGRKLTGNLLYSFDMLGEGARTDEDACRYLESYHNAIEEIGKEAAGKGVYDGPGISVKISALHPRYRFAQKDKTFSLLYGRLLELAKRAAHYDIGFTIDAEEADRLAFSLDLLEALAHAPELKGWQGLGLALQAYQKRAVYVVDWLADLADRSGRRLMVRLVKGAYWDTEIKFAQQHGLEDYPVFTTKSATDLSYLTCAQKLLANPKAVYPQFATHNAHTLSAILHMTGANKDFEFQRLHGMGDLLYKSASKEVGENIRCRVYAPVGSHEDLLPYLVRRLLENGANSSFVHSFLDDRVDVSEVVKDPLGAFEDNPFWRHPSIPLPEDIYGAGRKNSKGLDIDDARTAEKLSAAIDLAYHAEWQAGVGEPGEPVLNPADPALPAGKVVNAALGEIGDMVTRAVGAFPAWNALGGAARAKILRQCGDALEENMLSLIGLLAREAGKTWQDGVDEVREAVDFCRYYAGEAEKHFTQGEAMPGPTGETNELTLEGRGAFVCIAPWNFPLAIFTGQLMAALAAGNSVLAKPAEQTPLIAAEALRLFKAAGLPEEVLQLVLGDGAVGAALVADPRIAGVAFTGSTETAQKINRTLAARGGAIVPLIAETGGLNGMFVDSTALIEQVVDDVIRSAFGSAGQRCSALRILFVQDDIADKLIQTLKGAMDALVVGDPRHQATDVGPIIDQTALDLLGAHMARMENDAIILKQLDRPAGPATFFGPALVEIPSLDTMERETFGPVLHVLRFESRDLATLLEALREKNYGLTLGVHSRLKSFADQVFAGMPAGNTYVNRDMIGATVGCQPFGGCGLSGTGPKAGGPHYLFRFATERVRTENITAQGGNAALFCLDPGAAGGL
ncbi:MAG: bifunctional proline dehydrogenase/L-glutamate gamma-semialdehyde dehydrogenase PutA [Alphaproteobacteria bacterium]|nr:MAG: bifunctional proline dehydrogenase/L-glutamate gamma-semialdehyde dehydrogenase PutA [Alphaproteobacteria bacterium]